MVDSINMHFIPFIIFAIFFYYYHKVNTTARVSKLLLGIYTVSFLFTIVHKYTYSTDYVPLDLEIDSVLIFCSLHLMMLVPFLKVDETKINKIIAPDSLKFWLVYIFLMCIGLFSLLFFLPFVKNALLGDIGENRNMMAAGETLFVPTGIFNTIASIGGALYPIMLLFFFYHMVYIKGKRLLKIGMLIASTCYIVNVLAYVGRDGLVFWLSFYIFWFLFFKSSLTKKAKRVLLAPLIFFGLVGGIIFGVISIARSELGSESSLTGAIRYMGESPYNFNYYYNREFPKAGGFLCFPLFRSPIETMQGSDKAEPSEIRRVILGKTGVDIGLFPTYIGSWFIDFGIILTIILVIVLSQVFNQICKRMKGDIQFNQLIIFCLIFQIVYHGIFYFKLLNKGGNLYILSCLGLYFFLMPQSLKRKSVNIQTS